MIVNREARALIDAAEEIAEKYEEALEEIETLTKKLELSEANYSELSGEYDVLKDQHDQLEKLMLEDHSDKPTTFYNEIELENLASKGIFFPEAYILEIVSVTHPGIVGKCFKCAKKVSPTDYGSQMLPSTHPGSNLYPPVAISFVLMEFCAQTHIAQHLLCMDCALLYPEQNGYWEGYLSTEGAPR